MQSTYLQSEAFDDHLTKPIAFEDLRRILAGNSEARPLLEANAPECPAIPQLTLQSATPVCSWRNSAAAELHRRYNAL